MSTTPQLHNGHPGSNGDCITTTSNGLSTPTQTNEQPVICVFCGASPGTSPIFLSTAHSLARALHESSSSLIYGGGTSGMMGALSSTLVSLSGPSSVHGIIPLALMSYETSYLPSHGLDASLSISEAKYGHTTIVPDMHTRKRLMCESVQAGGPGSGFIALSGGFGTMEELMGMITWNQLGIHDKGIVVLNPDGYWDGMLKWVRDAVAAGFISEANGRILVEVKTSEEALEALRGYRNSKDRFDLQWGTGTEGM